jgi:hypothetical protein
MKHSFGLFCKDRRAGEGEWWVEADRDEMSLYDPDDRLVCRILHAEANRRFALPSFWMSVKKITFTTDKNLVIRFEPDPDDLRAVRAYLDDVLLEGGSGAIRKVRTRAWLAVALGLLLFLGSVGAFIATQYVFVGRRARRTWRPFILGAIVGLILLGLGIAGLWRARRLDRRALWEYEEDDDSFGQ